MEDIKKSISDFLKIAPFLSLGTVTKEGNPQVHTLAFASEGDVVYFSTDKTTRKAINITNNPNVSYISDIIPQDISKLKGVQMEGKASILSNKAEIEKAVGLMLAKFPMLKDMPQNSNSIFIKVEPKKASFLDYSKGFGHSDKVIW